MENTRPRTNAEALAHVEAMPAKQPGDEGYWRVWGASARDITEGDLVLVKSASGDLEALLIQGTFVAQAHPIRVGIVTDGERSTLGALVPVVVLRWGTKNTLSDYVR